MTAEFDHLPTASVPLSGPAVYFVTSRVDSTQVVAAVDSRPLDDPRERALCRALLLHALALLDATEPANPNGQSA